MKYTIIYSVYVGNNCYLQQMDRVETRNLDSLIRQDKYMGGMHFIFEGWPKLEGEEK